jgi:hypothetical protein
MCFFASGSPKHGELQKTDEMVRESMKERRERTRGVEEGGPSVGAL